MPHLLVIAEHAHGALKLSTRSAVAFARQVIAAADGGTFDLLLLGENLAALAASAARCGAATVLVADSPALAQPLADRYAHIIAEVARARGATLLAAASSTFSKDILPRAAALLDAGMIGDVIAVESVTADALVCRRVQFAGNVVATVRLTGAIKAVTLRAAAFPTADDTPDASPITAVPIDPARLPALSEFLGREEKTSGRPDPSEARIVVSGGRALKNADDFERLVGGLADSLGAAIGSSRALVDAGITPNSLQIGQTGKVVSPDLYLAIGISGAIQHMAGMKDARVIAAINKDAEAPIFDIADYGLVADVYDAVPELIAKLRA